MDTSIINAINPTVLFVDDDPMLLASLRRRMMTVATDWDMQFANSATVALELCEGIKPMAVVTDMRMPGMDGASLLSEVQSRFPDAIRIILTGQSDGEALVHAHVIAHTILTKPCDTERLYEVLQTCLEIRRRLGNSEIRELIARNQSIPVSPNSIRDILLLLRSPDVSVEQLTSIICTDLGLYAYIMKLINSSHYGMKSRIQDIDQAVMLLGATSLRAILCGLKLANALSALVDEKLCFEVFSLGVQRSQAVAKLGQHYRKNELFMNDCCVAALFQDFGKLILSVCLGDPYDALLQKSRVGTVPLIDLEREAYGCTHAEAGAYLLSLWSFPPSVVESICSHEDLRGPIEGEPQSIEDFVYQASQDVR